jgi:hypothetical protein
MDLSTSSLRISSFPLRNVFGAQIIGSTARLRRLRFGRESPVKIIKYRWRSCGTPRSGPRNASLALGRPELGGNTDLVILTAQNFCGRCAHRSARSRASGDPRQLDCRQFFCVGDAELAQGGHARCAQERPLLGVKRTWIKRQCPISKRSGYCRGCERRYWFGAFICAPKCAAACHGQRGL